MAEDGVLERRRTGPHISQVSGSPEVPEDTLLVFLAEWMRLHNPAQVCRGCWKVPSVGDSTVLVNLFKMADENKILNQEEY